MPLFDRIKNAVGMGEGETFGYRCRECGTEFESEKPTRSTLECPECAATGSRSLDRV